MLAKPLYIDLALVSVPKGAGERQPEVTGSDFLPILIFFSLKREGGHPPTPYTPNVGVWDLEVLIHY